MQYLLHVYNIISTTVLSIAPTHADIHGYIYYCSLFYMHGRKKLSDKHSVAIAANAACRDAVSENPSGMKEDYETLGMVLKSVNDHSISDRETEVDIYATISPSYKKAGVEESEYTLMS